MKHEVLQSMLVRPYPPPPKKKRITIYSILWVNETSLALLFILLTSQKRNLKHLFRYSFVSDGMTNLYDFELLF